MKRGGTSHVVSFILKRKKYICKNMGKGKDGGGSDATLHYPEMNKS